MISGLTESLLMKHASPMVVQRGSTYYERGAVISVVFRGDELQAFVEGSDVEPYLVRIIVDEAGITAAICTCPFDQGGWCKHVVATLLVCLHEPESVDERPPLDAILEALPREKLVELVRSLAAGDPRIAESIERACLLVDEAASVGPRRITKIDAKDVRRRVKSILHSLDHMRPSRAYWHTGSVADDIQDEIRRARSFLDAEDGDNALVYLEAVTEEYVDGWTDLDDSDGELGHVFIDLGDAVAEALLTADLSAADRTAWASKLERWQDSIDDYGLDFAFGVAIEAAEKGWDDPELAAIFEESGAVKVRPWRVDESEYDQSLTEVRLRILERRGREEEYLRLAGAKGHLVGFLTMLARMNLIDEAVTHGLELMAEPDQAFALARVLREQGAVEEALRIGEHGLTLNALNRAALAAWVSELAEGLGRPDRALDAALIAARDRPTPQAYRRAEALAGADWPRHRELVLEELRTGSGHAENRVEIFLHEGLVEDAVAVVDRQPHNFHLLRSVIEAAKDACPEWAAQSALRQAEDIIDRGQSALYDHAVEWLAHARDAYNRMDAASDWRAYLTLLQTTHARKYKLMRLIQQRL